MNYFPKEFKKFMDLNKVKPDGMTLQEMFDYKFGLIKQHELCTKLFDEIEAGQSKT